MFRKLFSMIKSLLETNCERCNNIATQHIEHTIFLGHTVNFLGQVVRQEKSRTEPVCDDCFKEQKRLDEIEFLQIVQLSNEYINGRHYLSQKEVEKRLYELQKR